MKKVNYRTAAELLMDNSFLAWYHQTDKTEVNKWEGWIEANPGKKKLADEAIHLLGHIMLAKEKVEVTEKQIKAVFDRITKTIITFEEQYRNTDIK